MVCEPCDWAFTLNRWRQGDFSGWDVVGLAAPIIPAKGLSSVLGRKLPLSSETRNQLRAEARDIWFEQTGRRAIGDSMEVHHRIPLEWAHV